MKEVIVNPEAIEKMEEDITSLNSKIAKSSELVTSSYGNVYYHRFGSVVVVVGDMDIGETPIATQGVIATGLPKPFRYNNNVMYVGLMIKTDKTVSRVALDSDGQIVSVGESIKGYAALELTYITSE